MAFSDVMIFAQAWATEPRRTGAVMPSGNALARLITSEIRAGSGPVLELGPGTGVFTRALLDRGIDQRDLTLVESAPNFAQLLQGRFPRARVLSMDARELVGGGIYEGRPLGAVISGLPLLSIPRDSVEQILRGAFAFMRASACFYQFTYGPRAPVPMPILERLGLVAARVGSTLRNLPPASVYRIRRR